jgi:neutral trehalase
LNSIIQFPTINSNLVIYTRDIAKFKGLIGDNEGKDAWNAIGYQMAQELNDTLFDGTIYRAVDARNNKGKMSEVFSLGGYMPMAAGVPTREGAAAMVNQLYKFKGPHGISNVIPETIPSPPTQEMLDSFPEGVQTSIMDIFRPRQWGDKEHPNEWPPRISSLVTGFTKYGYYNEAINIVENWLLKNTEYFIANNTLAEKLNTLTGQNGHGLEYGQQVDFGWTMAIYLWFLKELPRLYKLREEKDVFPAKHELKSVA